jgi:glycosyltransferase involved in cell wall biosynthesis
MPAFYHAMNVIVLPSLTRKHWKEQFGRVLIEAMACAVPVIGSDSGEIPNVISDAGIIFPEGNADALRAQLGALMQDQSRCAELGKRGRARALANFTQTRVAEETYAVYREMMEMRHVGFQSETKNQKLKI